MNHGTLRPLATDDDLRLRVQATLAQRSGAVHDQLDDPSHAPDHVGASDLTHCRIGAPGVWSPGTPAAH